MRYLMICEKPSLMREVKNCYNNHISEIKSKVGEIEFIALSGHICTNYEPNDYDEWKDLKWDDVDYPMIPTGWGVKMIESSYNHNTMKLIRERVDEFDGFIVGTDSDVEGYGIYYLLEKYLKISDRKALRFIEHSLTDEEILQSLLEMTDYHTDITHKHFTESFILRSRADWLYGMNATRMMSVKMNSLMAIGRVKTPTIKLVYDNSMEIENFKARDYYVLDADYGTFTASYTEDGKNPMKFDSIDDIPSVDYEGVIESKETNRVKTHAPKLYDLAAIQTEAGQSYGYKPDETLSIVQSLYETHKVISYPRTQCRYVSTEKAKEFKIMLSKMSVFNELKDIVATVTDDDIYKIYKDKQVVNDAEVQKESHDALLPTSTTPDLNKLTEKEKTICLMIYKRLLAQFLPPLEEDKTQILINHNGKRFITKGKIVINKGWRVLYSDLKDSVIPNVNEEDIIYAKAFKNTKKTTTPPKRLTQASLINAMLHIDTVIKDTVLKKAMVESKGLGTPATRSNIIKDILERGYVEDKKGGLYITDEGKRYIESVISLDITSPIFAAKMDTEIKKIQRGEAEFDAVYEDTIDHLNNMCNQIDAIEEIIPTINVDCIECGKNLRIGRYSYECPKCSLKIPKKIGEKTIDKDILQTLMRGEKTNSYIFKNKEGKQFSAKLVWDDKEKKLTYDFTSGIDCPMCNEKDIKLNKGGLFCNDECGFKLFRRFCGHTFSDLEIHKLASGKSLNNIHLKKKDGTTFTSNIRIKGDGELELFWDQKKKE